jgi:hypothetical protein
VGGESKPVKLIQMPSQEPKRLAALYKAAVEAENNSMIALLALEAELGFQLRAFMILGSYTLDQLRTDESLRLRCEVCQKTFAPGTSPVETEDGTVHAGCSFEASVNETLEMLEKEEINDGNSTAS